MPVTALLGCLLLPLVQGLTSVHTKLFNNVKDALGLKPTDFASKYDAAEFRENGFEGFCEWWDEAKGSKLTGVSCNCIRNPSSGFELLTLNCWMGPAYNCPHMLLSIGRDPSLSGSSIRADYLPRGPIPLGSDQTAMEMYFGSDVMQWYDSAVKASNYHFLPPSSSFYGRLLRSPVELAVYGLDDASVAAIATEHVERWISYVLDAQQNEARSRGAINTRDDKQRMFAYRAELSEATSWVGADFGPSLAAARTGPVAEAYVGGGG